MIQRWDDLTPEELRAQLAAVTARAEAAEVAAREQAERNLHNIDLCTQALQQRDEWRKRAEAAEAALAAVPVEALKRTLLTGYRTDAQITADADAINAWLGEAQP